jgi:hypothetical protein
MEELPARLDHLVDHVARQAAADDPLGRLGVAVVTAEQLGELADHLVGHFVDRAREAGASWADIGRALGVSKQAAQQRFVPRPGAEPDLDDDGRFSRFTPRARQVTLHARDEARAAGNDSIGTEHVLLGLLDEPDALAARALATQGVSLDDLRAATRARLAPRAADVPADIPFRPAAKKLVELTVREALRLGHNYIGTEHILLALFADESSVAGEVLAAAGVERGPVEQWIVQQLAQLTVRRAAGGAA